MKVHQLHQCPSMPIPSTNAREKLNFETSKADIDDVNDGHELEAERKTIFD